MYSGAGRHMGSCRGEGGFVLVLKMYELVKAVRGTESAVCLALDRAVVQGQWQIRCF